MSQLLFAAIADDFTGGSDLAGMLHAEGVRTVQTFGIPDPALLQGFDAAVVSLKTRSIEPDDAVRQSLQVLDAVKPLNPRQWQFKYCSTFDSTPKGNIGPVTSALLDALSERFTIAVPALPVNGRTQYFGHLFVHGELLSESPMRTHPLNPMTDSNLVRWLQLQTSRRCGLLPFRAVRSGAGAIHEYASSLRREGIEIALVDAIDESDMARIAAAFSELRFITAGSGLARHLPEIWKARGWLPASRESAPAPKTEGPALVLSGSCSAATLRQLENLRATGAEILPYTTPIERVKSQIEATGLAVVSSSAPPGARTPGAERDIEHALAAFARELATRNGVRRIVVAGGETSGAVVEALGIRAVELTGILDPGVPSLRTVDRPEPLSLALKSGNFGSIDFFTKALNRL
jgi:uncharacterized protein YgbK (DUF1537 family)